MARGGNYSQGQGESIPLGGFAPDKPPHTPGIILDASNAMPTIKGYRAMSSPTAYLGSAALPATPNGATVAYYSTQVSSVIAGTATKLYRLSAGGVWNDATGGTVFAPTSRWRFFQFGDDVIAIANGVSPQVANGSTGTFAALAGTPPTNATTGATTLGTAFLFPGAQWFASASGLDNNWVANVQTLAANGTLYDYPGPILGAAPFYQTMIAFKQAALWVGRAVGPPNSWAWTLISNDTGTWDQEAIIILPDGIAFLGTDDFYITAGTVPSRIPNDLKEWFFTNADKAQLANTFAWYDELNSTLYWHFVSLNTPFATVCDQFVSYNIRAGRWCRGHLITPCVPWPNTSPTIRQGLYFDNNNVLQQLSGAAGAASVLTGFVGDSNRLSQLFRVRSTFNLGVGGNGPVAPTTKTLRALHVNSLSDSPTPSPAPPVLGTDGWFNLRQTDRYHQVEIGWRGDAEVIDVTFEARPAGIR